MNEDDLKPHALAAIVPDMSAEEYANFVADVQANGIKQPIVLYKGMILDRRHRARACRELRITPVTVEFTGTAEEAEAYVRSINVHRRHLTPAQRRVIIAYELKRDPAQSDRAIAKKAMAEHKTVKAARRRAEANGEIPQKTERIEASGRKARGRKPSAPITDPADALIAADYPVVPVDIAPPKGTAPVTADLETLGEGSSSDTKKQSHETSERSTAAAARSVVAVAPDESVKLIRDSIRDTFALTDVAMIGTTCLTRLLAANLRSRILPRSALHAAATELEKATPKLRRRPS